MYATHYLPGPANFEITILPPNLSFPSPLPSACSSHSSSDMSDMEDSDSHSNSSADGIDSGVMSEAESVPAGRFFTVAERGFLVALEPEYQRYCDSLGGDGPRGLAGVKGDKGDWIAQNAQKPFFKKFRRWRAGNTDLEKARKKIRRHFYNAKKKLQRVPKPPVPKPGKKPRKVDPRSLFADEPKNAQKIAQVKAQRRIDEKVGQGGLLKLHNEIRNQLYATLSDDNRHKYIQDAAELDKQNRTKPSGAEIDSNQTRLAENVLDSLNALGGDQWGQHGDFAFYVVGAYKNSVGHMRMFSLSGGPKKAEKYSFSDHPDFDESLTKGPFSSWAADVLSCSSRSHRKGKKKATHSDLDLQFDSSRLPLMPNMDSPEELPIDVVRRLLVSYTRVSWQCELDRVGSETETDLANIPVPWDALNSGQAALYLSDFDSIETCVKSGNLDAHRCSDEDARLLFEMIIESQKLGIRRMDFLITDTIRDLLIMEHGLDEDEDAREFHDDHLAEEFRDDVEDASDEELLDQRVDAGGNNKRDKDGGQSKSSAADASTMNDSELLPDDSAKTSAAAKLTTKAKKSKSSSAAEASTTNKSLPDDPTKPKKSKASTTDASTVNKPLPDGPAKTIVAAKPKKSKVSAADASTTNKSLPDDPTKPKKSKASATDASTVNKPLPDGPAKTIVAAKPKKSKVSAADASTTNESSPDDPAKPKKSKAPATDASTTNGLLPDGPAKTIAAAKSKKSKASAAGASTTANKPPEGPTTVNITLTKKKRVRDGDDDNAGVAKPIVKRARIAWESVVPQRDASRRIHSGTYSNSVVNVRHKDN